MGLKNDKWIREQSLKAKGMISPFSESVYTPGVISYGLSSY